MTQRPCDYQKMETKFWTNIYYALTPKLKFSIFAQYSDTTDSGCLFWRLHVFLDEDNLRAWGSRKSEGDMKISLLWQLHRRKLWRVKISPRKWKNRGRLVLCIKKITFKLMWMWTKTLGVSKTHIFGNKDFY